MNFSPKLSEHFSENGNCNYCTATVSRAGPAYTESDYWYHYNTFHKQRSTKGRLLNDHFIIFFNALSRKLSHCRDTLIQHFYTFVCIKCTNLKTLDE